MNKLYMAFVAALLSGSSAYADIAPHWTTAIGTGHASERTSRSASTGTATNTSTVSSAPHWSALIGTGRVTGHSSRFEPADLIVEFLPCK
jgi:hypothetical protein